jgi:methionyl aminopeptidase
VIPEAYKKAGKITSEVREVVKARVRPGMSYLEACELVEEEIRGRGGNPAFPTGIGVNQVTAHYSPQPGDASVIKEDDLVKVDFGVHIDGYLADTAVSLSFSGNHELLLRAAEAALSAAVSAARTEARTGELGKVIRREAARLGFKTIENLTGHTVDRYVVHAGKSIPNLYVPGLQSLKKGEVFAIEPFVTLRTASGYVVDAPQQTIFSIVARKRTGSEGADRFAETVWEERKTLPFTPRWYAEETGARLKEWIPKLVSKKVVRAYPTLVEASGAPVAQFEHTMALDEDGLTVLT